MEFSDELEQLLITARTLDNQRRSSYGSGIDTSRLRAWRDAVFNEFYTTPIKRQVNDAFTQLESADDEGRVAHLLGNEVRAAHHILDQINNAPAGRRLKKGWELLSIVVGSLKELLGELIPGLGKLFTILQEVIDALT